MADGSTGNKWFGTGGGGLVIFNADSILGNGSVSVKGADGIYHGLGSGQWIGTGGSGGGFCLMISKERDCSGGDISVNIAGGNCVWGGSIHSGNRWCTDCSYDILVLESY